MHYRTAQTLLILPLLLLRSSNQHQIPQPQTIVFDNGQVYCAYYPYALLLGRLGVLKRNLSLKAGNWGGTCAVLIPVLPREKKMNTSTGTSRFDNGV